MEDKETPYRVALLYPADVAQQASVQIQDTRLSRIAAALTDVGIEIEGAPYADEVAEEVRKQLQHVDAVLVWVNPIDGAGDRSVLNALLEEVEAAGVFVSARPAVIRKMGTKEVLYHTRKID